MTEPSPRRRDIWRSGARRAVTSLGTISPAADPRWPIALQAAITLMIPLFVGIAVDRIDLGLLACVGAFTVPYFSALPRLERLRLRPIAGLVLTASAALGALLGPHPVAAAVGLAALATAVGLAVHGYRLGPPGPLFPVIVYGMSAHATGKGVPPETVIACVAAGCALAVVVSIAPLVRRRHWLVTPRPLSVLLARPVWDAGAKELAMRTAIVAVTCTALSALYVDPERAYWTVAAGVVVVGVVPGRGPAVSRGLHRMVGTIAGVGIYVAITRPEVPIILLALILGALQFVTEVAITRHYAIATAAVTPLSLILVSSAEGNLGALDLVGERTLDTVVGAGIAVATALLHRPAAPDPEHRFAPPHATPPAAPSSAD
ncbi:FUSC family protein [Demequina globuliformis]|uniref:FUSC family protein n=1 Tax=Demequina globuliformis TaxID=676202 RepID=UPI000785B4CA|nr:FUSC family protein [Demequina globuliformis]